MSETPMVVTPHHEQAGRLPNRPRPFRRPRPVAITTIVLIAPLVLIWYTVEVLLLVFAGVLLAVFLRGLSDGLSQYTPLGGNSALLVVVIMLVAIFGRVVESYLLTPLVQERTVSLPLPPSPSPHRCYRVFRSGLWG